MPADLDRLKDVLEDRYALERELGRGGMATVFLAADRKHNRQVAIKVLHPELSVTLGAERFLREIQIEARLNHPHILPLHDSGQADGILFYVMPYVEGESLRDRLKREGPLPVDEALQISKEVASALDYAHDAGLVHRDIKPENILLSAGQAVVADFGIARAVDEAGGEQLTATGMSVGTPAYMSPEQAAGEKEIDSRTDLYALGCVLYEMLTGEPPFTGPSAQAVMARKVSEAAPGFRAKREGVSEELEAVVLKALARAPEDRYETAGDLDQALTVGLPRTEWVREGRRSRARTLSLGAAGAVLVGAGILWLANPFGAGAAERSIGVLPCDHVAPDPDSVVPADRWFAEGLTEELLANLGRGTIIGMAADRNEEPEKIGRNLRTQYYVRCSIREQGGRVRAALQIVEASTGSQVWGKVFTGDSTDFFSFQSEIADSAAAQLPAIGITPSDRDPPPRLSQATENQEALQEFQKGKSRGAYGVENHARAVELDPEFAWAWAELSRAHVAHLWYNLDKSEERRAQARAALDRAVQLAPQDPVVMYAQAHYLDRVDRAYDQALSLYEKVAEAVPWPFEVEVDWAACFRRAGRWEEAIEHWRNAITLNPSNARWWWELALTYGGLGQFDEALRYYDLAIERGSGHGLKALVYLAMGRLDSARLTLLELDRLEGPPEVGGLNESPMNWFWQEYLEGKFEEAIHRLEAWGDSMVTAPGYRGPKQVWIGVAYQALGQIENAREQYESARVLLENRLPEQQANARVHRDLSIVYAGLDRSEEAVEAAQLALAMHEDDGFWRAEYVENLAFVYTTVSEYEAALDRIEELLSLGGHFTVAKLALDHRWAPLRDHPRYSEIVERYGD
jgi:serine/threonine-protein kinase